MIRTAAIPRSPMDVFTDHTSDGPYEAYREIREAGAVVYLETVDAYAISRYDDVRRVLTDWTTFRSCAGTAFNPVMNENARGTILHSEPPEHGRLRAALTERLRLSSVLELTDWVDTRAEEMVRPLVSGADADISTELAQPFPAHILGQLIGLKPEMTEKFVVGSEAVFAAMGPLNDRAMTALQVIGGVLEMISRMRKDDLEPGSMGHQLYEAAERGDLPPENTIKLLWNYAGPAFDTTIQGINNAVWLLASHPAQFDRLRSDPSLIPGACNEALRYEPPIQVWGRMCDADTEIDGVVIPERARVAVLLAAANRDERHYRDADQFDVGRNPTDLLSFGHGIHSCIGASLARLEIEAVLRALVRHVARIEVREATRISNNTVRGFRRLLVRLSAE